MRPKQTRTESEKEAFFLIAFLSLRASISFYIPVKRCFYSQFICAWIFYFLILPADDFLPLSPA